ncbi:hypothetical protein CBR_g15958 [Chara braunii]|uniref:Uncharacterized protein n=1 Tax=Chara braunii TaxID=69332 RepID=A0A388JSS3_CHABU|nr:hypothetical protein CBR_g15958 [Chara braunii]|eukprot:GBG60835.1 hypothetical protein CBR_g15958 [Chara braunii]
MAESGGQEGGGNGVHAGEEDGGEVQGGELLFCGNADWALKKGDSRSDDRSEKFPFILEPSRLASMKGIKIVHVAAGCVSSHCVAVDVDGRCFTWGKNDTGQLGLGDTLQRNVPVHVSGLSSKIKVIKAAAGRHHTVVVGSDGSSYSFGQNKHGQLGTGSIKGEMEVSPVKALVQDAFDVACGGEFTLWLTDVSLLSAGLPQYGQLGHGTDHEYNNASGTVKLVYEPQPLPRAISTLQGKKIVKAACGINHSVVVDSEGFVYTWGFGGHGRLGHREQKDEWKPRMLDVFKGGNKVPSNGVVGAGGAFSAASAAGGQLYTWGRVKMTGDSIMYPKALMTISGWTIRSLDCGSMTTLAAAESSCISWGTAQYGELGYGANGPKSSALPKKIDSLEGMHVHKVAAGVSHSLFIVDVKGNGKEMIEKLPVFESKAGEAVTDGSEHEVKGGGKRKAGGAPAGPAKGAGRGRGKRPAIGKDKPVLKSHGADVAGEKTNDKGVHDEDGHGDEEAAAKKPGPLRVLGRAGVNSPPASGRGRGRGRGAAAAGRGAGRGRGRGSKKQGDSESEEPSSDDDSPESDSDGDDTYTGSAAKKKFGTVGLRPAASGEGLLAGAAAKGSGRGRGRGRGRGKRGK